MHVQYPCNLYSLLTIADFDITFVCRWFPSFTLCVPLLVSFPIYNFLKFHLWHLTFCIENSFSICCEAGLVVLLDFMSSLRIYLSVKLLISLPNLNYSLLWCRVFLVVISSLSSL